MPIDKKIEIPKEEKKEYPPIPQNVYQVELLDVTLEEKPKYKKPDELENVLNFQFVLLNGKDKEESLRGRNIWKNFVPTYLYIGSKGKNNLYQIIEALIGRELDLAEEAEMSSDYINGLIGKQCRIVTINKTKDDKTYSNIDSFLVAEGDLTPLTEEEKENAKVKKDKEEKTEETEEEIQVENIPFN